jgi:CubicO group peptidase (beta-lactamase class C family)
VATGVAADLRRLGAALDPDGLQAELEGWLSTTRVPGLVAGISFPDGRSWFGAAGTDGEGRPRRVDEVVDVMSVTKMFTANLVLRAADAGLVDLDAPVGAFDAYPEFPYAGLVTPRQLLAHRSGIPNYWDSPRYAFDPLSVRSPVDGVDAAAGLPLLAEPGTRSEYSSTNYLILGLLLEQVTGRSFHELLRDELLGPLGLTETTHLPPEPGFPRGATAGVNATLPDLGRAGLALLRERVGLSGAAVAVLSQIDDTTGIGPGINGYCPCAPAGEGGLRYFALGHTGGHTLVAYLPDHDAVVTLDVTGTFWVDRVFEEVMALVERLAVRAAGGALPEPAVPLEAT